MSSDFDTSFLGNRKLLRLAKRTPIRPPGGTGLPGYVWDTRMRGGRWRRLNKDGSLGRLVSHKRINTFLRELHQASTEQFRALGSMVAAGEISPAVFEQAMATELKALHNASAALGRGGWAAMDQAAWGRSGAVLRKEYAYLHNFTRLIEEGKLTPGQIMYRAGLYSDAGYGRYWQEKDRSQRALGAHRERLRTVGDERTCPICLDIEAEGWKPIGTIVVPVHLVCRCDKEYD